jgi:hypothetical protein
LSSVTGSNNTYLGNYTAFEDTAGSNNTLVGRFAGLSGRKYAGVTLLGDSADAAIPNAINATAIGLRAVAECDSCLVLGSVLGKNNAISNVKVGIGTTNPTASLDVAGTLKIGTAGTAVQQITKFTAAINIPIIAANTATNLDVAVAGVQTGSAVTISLEGDTGNVFVTNAYVNATGNVRIKLFNPAATASVAIATNAYILSIK